MPKAQWLLVGVLALSGCARGSGAVSVEWRGAEERRQLAQEAADEWANVCNAAIVTTKGTGLPVVEILGDVDGIFAKNGNTAVDPEGRATEIVVSVVPSERAILTHEFGHALGIVNHAPHGLMAAAISPNAHVTPEDCKLLPEVVP